MPDNQQPEQKEQTASEKKEDKPKQPSTLESAVTESWNGIKALTNTGIGAAAIYGASRFFGLDGLVTALSFPYGAMIENNLIKGKKKPYTSKKFRDESIAGAAFTVPLWYGVNALRQIPKAFGLDGLVNILGYSMPLSALAVGGLALASIPLLNVAYYGIKYLADNKTFKGIGKDFKENYWKGTKRSLFYLGLPWAGTVAASVAFPWMAPILFPILAGFEAAYRVVLSKEKLNYWKLLNPLNYVPKIINPFYLAGGLGSASGKIYRGITSAGYSLGSWMRDIFKTASSPAPQTKPA